MRKFGVVEIVTDERMKSVVVWEGGPRRTLLLIYLGRHRGLSAEPPLATVVLLPLCGAKERSEVKSYL